jgi:chromosome segregation ATPase
MSVHEQQVKILQEQLQRLKEECAAFEHRTVEVQEAKNQVQLIDAERDQLEDQLEKLKRRITTAEAKKKESGPKILAGRASDLDTSAMGKVVSQLQARKKNLLQLKKFMDDPMATIKEEDALAGLAKEIKSLEKGQVLHLEMRLSADPQSWSHSVPSIPSRSEYNPRQRPPGSRPPLIPGGTAA